MTKLSRKEPGPLSRRAGIVQQAANSLQRRRHRGEAVDKTKRKTTKDVYMDAWSHFAAYLRYYESKQKADLLRWARRKYVQAEELERLEGMLGKVRHQVVQEYRTAMLNVPCKGGIGLSASTIGVRLSALKYLFQVALREGVLEYNPASTEYVDRCKEGGGVVQKHVLTLDEVRTVLGAYPGANPIDRRNRMLFLLLAWTGIRREEAVQLMVGSFTKELEGLLMQFRRKGDKATALLIPGGLEKALQIYVDELHLTGPLFPAMRRYGSRIDVLDRALTADAVTHIVLRMTRETLGSGYGPHCLRHCFATVALEKGATIDMVQEYLGHENARTTRRYAHLKPSRKRSAAELIDPMEEDDVQV